MADRSRIYKAKISKWVGDLKRQEFLRLMRLVASNGGELFRFNGRTLTRGRHD